jgi:hypothetical protein
MQRTLGNQGVQTMLSAQGERLAPEVRAEMESRFGHDFSAVRVHAGADAALVAEAEGAQAFTLGQHVVFAGGRYAPDTGAGRALLVHELAHVVQQRRGGLQPVGVATGALEAEARHAASGLADGGPVVVDGASGVGIVRQPNDLGRVTSSTGRYAQTVHFRTMQDYAASEATEGVEHADGSVTAVIWRDVPPATLSPAKPAAPLARAAHKPRPTPAPVPPVDPHVLQDLALGMMPTLTYPKPVRQFLGGLQFMGGSLEAGVGGVGGLATAETGVGLAAGGFLLLHGADTASSGWHTMWTGEASRTYTFRLGAGLASAAGADPKLANAVGSSTELIADIGSAGLSLSMMPAPTLALAPEVEAELRMARLARLETLSPGGQAPRSAGAAGLNDWDVFTPPGEWVVIRRPASDAMELQAIWSETPERPYMFSGNNILVMEYRAGGVDFDRAMFDQFGSLDSLNEFKSSYAGSIARGDLNVARRLRVQALSQIRVANELGVPLEWHVPANEMPMFQNALGPWRSARITWMPYTPPVF